MPQRSQQDEPRLPTVVTCLCIHALSSPCLISLLVLPGITSPMYFLCSESGSALGRLEKEVDRTGQGKGLQTMVGLRCRATPSQGFGSPLLFTSTNHTHAPMHAHVHTCMHTTCTHARTHHMHTHANTRVRTFTCTHAHHMHAHMNRELATRLGQGFGSHSH